ncbi:BamA/OMP85 family outer membrane protein [Mariniblastus fucicola]|uniref:BamA/OMP85 family outer membrane protein n=1 Tax=Mariniblastus fucicola TaxID=980251 RepID=UPI00138FED2E|nr:POTRA domain-containing protein [Mariniblastus fucicola]
MTGVLLQTRHTKTASAQKLRHLPFQVMTVVLLLTAIFLSGCQSFGNQFQTSMPIPDPVLDTSQLDNVRYQSPQAPGGGQAGTPGMLNKQSHRLTLDGPIVSIDENADQSQLIAEVNFRGNSKLASHQLRRNISTRPGRYYDPDKLQQDVQQLWKMPEIARVNGPYIEQTDNGIVVTFDIEERNAIADITFIGNRGIDDRTLRKESGLGEIGHLDVHRIRMAKSRIEELYRERGFPRTQVEIKEGNESNDSQIVFLIHEDQQQRIWKVEFEGNSVAPDGRLKSLIKAKPGILKVFGGLAQKKQIDQDIVRLESYYKSLGYFSVQIGRDISESNDGRWLTVRFIINEGPRYKVREVRFVGNERYDSEDLEKLLKLKPGAEGQPEFNSARMSEDVGALRDLYGANGFVYANVEAEPRFLEEPGYLDMVYRISEGEQYRVGQINVNYNGGNGITRREVILNRLSLRPGDLIDARKLRTDEIRLGSARIFATGQEAGGSPPRIVVRPPERGSEFNRIAKKLGGVSSQQNSDQTDRY